MPPPHQNIDHLPQLGFPPNHRINAPRARLRRKIDGIGREMLTCRCRANRPVARHAARRHGGCLRGSSRLVEAQRRRSFTHICADADIRCDSHEQIGMTDRIAAEPQRRCEPRCLDPGNEPWRECRRPARTEPQTIQGAGEFIRHDTFGQIERRQQSLKVAIAFNKLREPMLDLDSWMAARGRASDRSLKRVTQARCKPGHQNTQIEYHRHRLGKKQNHMNA